MPTERNTNPIEELLNSFKKMKEQAAQHDFLQEFLSSKTKMQAGKAEQNLNKLVRFELPDHTNRVMTNEIGRAHV